MGFRRPYLTIRDWTDGLIARPGLDYKATLVPAAAIPLVAVVLGAPRTVLGFTIGFAVLWLAFVSWRFWLYLRAEVRRGDELYDRKGKYRLSKEYHDTESASAAAERKRKS